MGNAPFGYDFSRKVIAHDARPDETAFSSSDILETMLENACKEGPLPGKVPMSKLCPDSGSGFSSKLLAKYLSQRGMQLFLKKNHPDAN